MHCLMDGSGIRWQLPSSDAAQLGAFDESEGQAGVLEALCLMCRAELAEESVVVEVAQAGDLSAQADVADADGADAEHDALGVGEGEVAAAAACGPQQLQAHVPGQFQVEDELGDALVCRRRHATPQPKDAVGAEVAEALPVVAVVHGQDAATNLTARKRDRLAPEPHSDV